MRSRALVILLLAVATTAGAQRVLPYAMLNVGVAYPLLVESGTQESWPFDLIWLTGAGLYAEAGGGLNVQVTENVAVDARASISSPLIVFYMPLTVGGLVSGCWLLHDAYVGAGVGYRHEFHGRGTEPVEHENAIEAALLPRIRWVTVEMRAGLYVGAPVASWIDDRPVAGYVSIAVGSWRGFDGNNW